MAGFCNRYADARLQWQSAATLWPHDISVTPLRQARDCPVCRVEAFRRGEGAGIHVFLVSAVKSWTANSPSRRRASRIKPAMKAPLVNRRASWNFIHHHLVGD